MTGIRNPCLTQDLFRLARLLAGLLRQFRLQDLKRDSILLRYIQMTRGVGKNSSYKAQRTQWEHRAGSRLTMPSLMSFHITMLSQA